MVPPPGNVESSEYKLINKNDDSLNKDYEIPSWDDNSEIIIKSNPNDFETYHQEVKKNCFYGKQNKIEVLFKSFYVKQGEKTSSIIEKMISSFFKTSKTQPPTFKKHGLRSVRLLDKTIVEGEKLMNMSLSTNHSLAHHERCVAFVFILRGYLKYIDLTKQFWENEYTNKNSEIYQLFNDEYIPLIPLASRHTLDVIELAKYNNKEFTVNIEKVSNRFAKKQFESEDSDTESEDDTELLETLDELEKLNLREESKYHLKEKLII